jgi:hypothetical protein
MKDVVGRIRTKDTNVRIIRATLTSAPVKPDQPKAKTGGRSTLNISSIAQSWRFVGSTSSHPDHHARKGRADLWKAGAACVAKIRRFSTHHAGKVR